MKCVRTFGTGRHKRQADITFLFQYIYADALSLLLSTFDILTFANGLNLDQNRRILIRTLTA